MKCVASDWNSLPLVTRLPICRALPYGGSNPPLSTIKLVRRAGVTQLVESQPSKLLVAGSSPVSRSRTSQRVSPRSSGVEHVLGKDGVPSSNLGEGSTNFS